MNEEINKKLIVVETIGSVCWFFMDASWMFAFAPAAKILAVFTLAFSLLVFRYTERTLSQMLVTAAMASWAAMNVSWMLHDLKSWDDGLTFARIFFGVGTVCLAVAMVAARGSIYTIIARFRRLRTSVRSDKNPKGD